jgi:preprotein translocase subunit SecG
MKLILSISQIVIAIALAFLILAQQRGTALGSAFGGDSGGVYTTRRGIQKNILWLTVVFGVLFIISAILNLVF